MTLDALDRVAYAAVAITAGSILDVAGTELTFLGWRTLVILGEAPAPMRLSDLAACLRLSRPSASKLVRRLEKRQLVALGPNPEDGRSLLVGLGSEGRRVRDAVVGRRREILAEALRAPLSANLDDGMAEIAGRLEHWI